ncbi:MAG: hypothetical protein RR250_02850 [Akkermansia sp.]
MNDNNAKNKEAADIIQKILTGCGVPANWAKVIAGAVIGGVIAYMALTSTGCAASGSMSIGNADLGAGGLQFGDVQTTWSQSTPEEPPVKPAVIVVKGK